MEREAVSGDRDSGYRLESVREGSSRVREDSVELFRGACYSVQESISGVRGRVQ